MSTIRIPVDASDNIERAFRDVQLALDALEAARSEIRELRHRVTELETQLASTPVRPEYTILGDTVVEGDLRVNNSLTVRGSVSAPVVDGLIKAVPAGTGGASLAQRVVCINGSVHVLNSIEAHTITVQNIQTLQINGVPV